jgi:hypothetical protein
VESVFDLDELGRDAQAIAGLRTLPSRTFSTFNWRPNFGHVHGSLN